MIIGIDAGALSITDERLKVGVWRVTSKLLAELANIDKVNEYRLYSFLPLNERFGPNFRNVVVRPKIGWASIQLPIELRLHPVDIFLGLSQMMPLSSAIKIGFIYDMGFVHHPDDYPDSLKKLRRLTDDVVRRSDAVVTISKFSAADIHHPHVTVSYPGVDAHFTKRGPKHTERRPYILFVGALKRGKNVPMAIRIFEAFNQKVKTKHDMVIVGGNYWEDPDIAKLLKPKHVILKGFVPEKDLPSYYRGAEALLITSNTEGFCLPATEAMACGCPVVYRKNGSLPEIVGRNGKGFGTEEEAVSALLAKKSTPKPYRRSWSEFAHDVYDVMLA